ncbi:hypothetical protein F4781DRAFT_413468 [Annulohypoxylon bovei var. microspora]|nr:hypothetical protein F4781DRAFT_413468 [Annulohypoxylon bovei var. microspora]
MPSSVSATQTKYVFDNDEDGTVPPPYLPTSIDKSDKQGTFVSEVSTVVDIHPDLFSSDTLAVPVGSRGPSPGPPLKPLRTYHNSGLGGWFKSTWQKNKAPLLMFLAQFFGALMNLAARLLEVDEEPMHPIQLLFVRQVMTTVFSSLYIWRKRIPHGILGPKNVRYLLVLRGFCGFFGIYGMWYSVKYIPLAEATVITFLAPNLAGYMCRIFIHDTFTRREQLASFIALGGVVLITRPVSLFSGVSPPQTAPSTIATEAVFNATAEASYPGGEHISTSAERLKAIGVALLGVLGAAGAITSLRCIGKRAHPLVSVNYFGTWCVIVTTTILSVAPALDYAQPELRLELPHSIRRWALLVVVGACGLIMQMLMTAGLAVEKSNRATAMMYTHMLFAAGFDRWVFGHIMGWMSLTGCGLIVGSALWVALTKNEVKKDESSNTEAGIVPVAASGDNESLFTIDDETDTDEEEGVMLRRL